jgi:hypothetical protein
MENETKKIILIISILSISFIGVGLIGWYLYSPTQNLSNAAFGFNNELQRWEFYINGTLVGWINQTGMYSNN